MRIKEYEAPSGGFRVNDSGYNAFETEGRRVGGSYNQAASDLKEIGRVQADTTTSIGRWPFNILELQKQIAARRAALYTASTNTRTGGAGGIHGVSLRVRGGAPSASDFPEMRYTNLATVNQMAEGANAFGQLSSGLVGGGGISTQIVGGSRRGRSISDSEALRGANMARQLDREQQRRMALDAAASQKAWDAEVKRMGDQYNQTMKDANEWYYNQPYVNPTSYDEASPYYERGGNDYGGTGDVPNTDYGGGGSTWYNPFSWSWGSQSTSSTPEYTPTPEDFDPDKFNPSY